jgi:hypothetical protein
MIKETLVIQVSKANTDLNNWFAKFIAIEIIDWIVFELIWS